MIQTGSAKTTPRFVKRLHSVCVGITALMQSLGRVTQSGPKRKEPGVETGFCEDRVPSRR